MAKKVTAEQERLIQKLYFEDGKSISAIARKIGVSYNAIWGRTKLRERGVESLAEYRQKLAEKCRDKNSEFADFLYQRMEALGIDRSELVRRTGFSKQLIHYYTTGVYAPGKENAKKLAKALTVSLRTLDKLIAPE